MDEHLVTKTNEAVGHLLDRLEHDIKTLPPDQLPYTANVLCVLMDFKNAMQNNEGNQRAQEALMRSLRKKIDGSDEGGISFGFPPQPPQQ